MVNRYAPAGTYFVNIKSLYIHIIKTNSTSDKMSVHMFKQTYRLFQRIAIGFHIQEFLEFSKWRAIVKIPLCPMGASILIENI